MTKVLESISRFESEHYAVELYLPSIPALTPEWALEALEQIHDPVWPIITVSPTGNKLLVIRAKNERPR